MITTAYYKGVHGFVVVFDLTSAKSFERADFYIQEIHRVALGRIHAILVGTKCDRIAERAVSQATALVNRSA